MNSWPYLLSLHGFQMSRVYCISITQNTEHKEASLYPKVLLTWVSTASHLHAGVRFLRFLLCNRVHNETHPHLNPTQERNCYYRQTLKMQEFVLPNGTAAQYTLTFSSSHPTLKIISTITQRSFCFICLEMWQNILWRILGFVLFCFSKWHWHNFTSW